MIKVHKTKDYTVMSRSHLRDKGLSLKAKGLMSLMLSLPEDWDYSVKGLATLSKDGKESVMGAIKELEEHGYLVRTQIKDNNGRFVGYDYEAFEKPSTGKPFTENPTTENPTTENPTQYNIEQYSKEKYIIEENNIKDTYIKKESSLKRKEEEIKNKEKKEKELPFSEELNTAIEEWFAYKKEKKQTYTAIGKKQLLNRLKEMVGKHNETYVAEVIRYSMSQNWQGIYEPKLTENKNISKQSLLPDDSWLPE